MGLGLTVEERDGVFCSDGVALGEGVGDGVCAVKTAACAGLFVSKLGVGLVGGVADGFGDGFAAVPANAALLPEAREPVVCDFLTLSRVLTRCSGMTSMGSSLWISLCFSVGIGVCG